MKSEEQPYFHLSKNEHGKMWLMFKPDGDGRYKCWEPITGEFWQEFEKLLRLELDNKIYKESLDQLIAENLELREKITHHKRKPQMIVAAILSLAVALYCYAITQLHQHGQLKWSKNGTGFWDQRSWNRKYKWDEGGNVIKAPNNFYYKYIARVSRKERWFTSTWLTVSFTDGYHLFQALFFSFLSLSFALAIGFNWWSFLGIFIGVRIIHWSARKIFSK